MENPDNGVLLRNKKNLETKTTNYGHTQKHE